MANKFPCNPCPTKFVNCCQVMDCIDIKSSDNSITVVKDQCGIDLTMTGNNLDQIFKLNDNECISFTKEFIDGVLTYTPNFDPGCAGTGGTEISCAVLEDLFVTNAGQYNETSQTDYSFLSAGNECARISAPTGFAVRGANRLSAFGTMEWFETLADAVTDAVAGETVLIYNDSSTSLPIKNGVNYLGIGLVKVNGFTLAGNQHYTGNIANIDFQTDITISCDTPGATNVYTNNVFCRGNLTLTGSPVWKGGTFLGTTSLITTQLDTVIEDIYSLSKLQISGNTRLNNIRVRDITAPSVALGAVFVTSSTGVKITNLHVDSINHTAIFVNAILDGGHTMLTHSTGISVEGNGIYWHSGGETQVCESLFSHCVGRSVNMDGIQVVRSGPNHDDLPPNDESQTLYQITHNTGYSVNRYGIFVISSNIRNCSGFSENFPGIRVAGSDWAYLNTNLLDCTGESKHSNGLSINRDCRVTGGTYISGSRAANGYPIILRKSILRPVENYHICGVKTITTSTNINCYAIAEDPTTPYPNTDVKIAGNIFINPHSPFQVVGIDPALISHGLRTVVFDSWGNIT